MSKPDAWGVTKGDEILKQQKEETRFVEECFNPAFNHPPFTGRIRSRWWNRFKNRSWRFRLLISGPTDLRLFGPVFYKPSKHLENM